MPSSKEKGDELTGTELVLCYKKKYDPICNEDKVCENGPKNST